jgi:Asp-tRNA(Asn)/Glu-tRNA(Gln) amidotransferase A subunit family amidase
MCEAPVGLMLTGEHGTDHALLSLAAAIESLLIVGNPA